MKERLLWTNLQNTERKELLKKEARGGAGEEKESKASLEDKDVRHHSHLDISTTNKTRQI